MHKLRNATYGQFPKLQFYCAMHKTYGAKLYIVRGGSSGGKKQPTTWDGVKFWYDFLDESKLQQIIAQKYFNRPSAVAAAEGKWGLSYFSGAFDPKKFLVRVFTAGVDEIAATYPQGRLPTCFLLPAPTSA